MSIRGALRLHGALDLGFAGLYAWVGFSVVRGRSMVFDIALGAVVALLAVAGLALLAGARIGRPLGIAASTLLLAFCLVVVALLVAGVAYLRGIYGPLGQGMAFGSVVAAALVIELFGLLPIFQLRLLLRRDVARHLAGG
ncbi:MAG: hypothetical protein EXR72_17650 [Myxococcales bacterium]|nr:hypothetical protein [Myxococcales bacterium]